MPSEQSSPEMIDRIAGAFGFPGPDGETTTARPAQDDEVSEPLTEAAEIEATTQVIDDAFADIEWDGQSYRIPTTLKEAVMRTEDYTKKTQELAEQRRAVEQVKSLAESHGMETAFRQSISAEQQDIGIIDAYLKNVSSIDWASMSTEQMMRQRIEIDQVKERREALAQAINEKRGQFNSQMQARINELRGKAREIASKSIQGFGEDTEKTMRDFAKSEGLADSEIDNVLLDPRSFKIIYKAMQFDKVRAGTAKAGEQARQADKGALRPGVAGQRMPAETARKLDYGKAMKAANTSGQKAQVIEQRLAGVFAKRK